MSRFRKESKIVRDLTKCDVETSMRVLDSLKNFYAETIFASKDKQCSVLGLFSVKMKVRSAKISKLNGKEFNVPSRVYLKVKAKPALIDFLGIDG